MLWKPLLALLVWALSTNAASDRSAPIDVSGERLAVANLDSASITLLDTASRAKLAEIRIGSVPQTITIDGALAYVACNDGRLVTIDLDARRILASVKVGVELYGVVSDGERRFVSDSGGATVLVIDGQTVTSIATEEYPRGLALEGGRLYVTHFRTGRVSVIDTTTLAVTNVISTGPDSNLSQSIAVSGTRGYLPQTRTNTTNQSLLFDTTVFPVVSIVDLQTGENIRQQRFAIDVVDRPINMPLDVAISPAGRLYVVHAGSDDVSVIDTTTRKSVAHIAVGRNPRGIAISNGFAYVSNSLSGTVSVIDTATDRVVDTIAVTTIPLPANLLNGKVLFNSASRTSLAKDQWISCATCHFEGSVDGRTWFFSDGPRNTTPIFGVSATLPMHWSGDLDELQDVENTVRVIQAGSGLASGDAHCEPACDRASPNAGRSADLDDLAAFMASMRPPRRDAVLTDAAMRGRALFDDPRVDCASCHPAPLYTDRRTHDVGTGGDPKERKGSAFDTPSLRGLFDTAPYLHDGSAATLHDVLARHGRTSALTSAERDDLVAFLKSLPFLDSRRRATGS